MREFRRSSRCNSGGCVEVAVDKASNLIYLRASEDPKRVITFTMGEWTDFAAAVRSGEFD